MWFICIYKDIKKYKKVKKSLAIQDLYVYNINSLGVKRSSTGLKWRMKECEDMTNNFLGESKHSLENGNRIIIPSGFRKFLASEFVLFKAPDRCLSIYEKENFDELLSQLNAISNTKEGRMKARKVTSSAKTLSLDKQGRFTIPADYLEYAGLEDVVYLAGVGNRLEIWSEKAYLEQQALLSDDMYPDMFY